MKSLKHTPPILAGLALLALVAVFSSPRSRQEPLHATEEAPPEASTRPVRKDALAEFSAWLDTRPEPASATAVQAPPTARVLELARERRVVMESLIRTDPQLALENAVTLDVWLSLPAELRAEVEEPFSAMARYQVLPVCGQRQPGVARPDAVRYTHIEGLPQLDTHVFGKRLGIRSKEQAPVQGIRLGGLAALQEGTFRKLSAEEIPLAKSIYQPMAPDSAGDFATGEPLGDEPVLALAGGKLFQFKDDSSLETFSAAIDALDEGLSPRGGSSLVYLPYLSKGSGAGFNLIEAGDINRSYDLVLTGAKNNVLMIRCDFSDRPNSVADPVPDATTYATQLNGVISDTIRDYSYGKTWIEATVSPTIIRLPQTAAYYSMVTEGSSRNAQILTDAKAAFLAANPSFPIGTYQIVGIWFTDIDMISGGGEYGGLAGGSDLWIQGNENTALHVHEFGHNYGIHHSSFWKPTNTNPFDPAGAATLDEEEYGDPFDVMGDGPVPEGVFHSQAKQLLNWLTAGEWTDTTAAGSATHRLNRIDHPDTTGVRGLRVTKGADEYLWLSYRRLFQNNALKAGANIVWERPGFNRSWLIDTTPGSQSGNLDRTDGSLAIGRTLTIGDNHITPLARGGSGANEWLDVRVNTGPFPGNTAPTVTLAGPSTVNARQTVVFTAQASDPNGDTLAYSWDFGQGFAFDNNPTATFAWTLGGTFTVKVTVSDMKGLTAQATKIVTVTGNSNTWTERSNTSVGTFNALAASPNKVIAVGDTQASPYRGPVATSPDGTNWTATQLALNQHAYGAIWDGTQFLLAGREYNGSSFIGCILASPTANAASWARNFFSGPVLRGITHGNGVYVAVGESGTIIRSVDGGATWNPVTSGTTKTLNSVSYGGGRFVTVGFTPNNGNTVILTSPDGLTWTNTSTGVTFPFPTVQDLRYIKWTHDRFLASGWYGELQISTDLGATFDSSRTNRENLPALAYGNGIYFAAGFDHDNGNADVDLISADGVNWTNLTTPAVENRNAAIFFNNTFITAGVNNSIRQSSTIAQDAGGFFSWRESNLPDHGPLSTPGGDQDGDGLENLIEYALGRSPNSGAGSDGPASLPQAIVTAGEPDLAGRLVLQASLPEPAASDVVHVIEASSTLTGSWTTLATKTGTGSWTWNAGGTSRIVTSAPSGGRVTVKVGDSVTIASDPHRFMRLRAQVNQ